MSTVRFLRDLAFMFGVLLAIVGLTILPCVLIVISMVFELLLYLAPPV